MDINKNKEFATFLEICLPDLMKHKVECAAIIAIIDGGDVFNAYCNAGAADKSAFVQSINADIVLEIVKNNIYQVRDALKELEADDE